MIVIKIVILILYTNKSNSNNKENNTNHQHNHRKTKSTGLAFQCFLQMHVPLVTLNARPLPESPQSPQPHNHRSSPCGNLYENHPPRLIKSITRPLKRKVLKPPNPFRKPTPETRGPTSYNHNFEAHIYTEPKILQKEETLTYKPHQYFPNQKRDKQILCWVLVPETSSPLEALLNRTACQAERLNPEP